MARIYLDNAAGRPVDPRVMEYAQRFLTTDFGNPSSLHGEGQKAKAALAEARKNVAGLINAESERTIIFTSGATESNNLAVRGTALRNRADGKEIVASAVEHMSVLNPCKELQKNGFEFTVVKVDADGIIDLAALGEAVTEQTVVTSVMFANYEIGTLQPIEEVSRRVHEKGGYLHVDATAAGGHLPIDVQEMGIDLLTLSSNDMGGPRGAGALYVKPGVKIQTVMPGGGQENGFRSGTENMFAIAGFGEAARLAKEEMVQEGQRLAEIRDRYIEEILKIDESFITGHPEKRLPDHASFRFSRIEGESILLNLEMLDIHVATGSACSSKTLQPSHVLLAIGLKHEEAHGSLIISLGRENTMDQVPVVCEAVKKTVGRLREMSPL